MLGLPTWVVRRYIGASGLPTLDVRRSIGLPTWVVRRSIGASNSTKGSVQSSSSDTSRSVRAWV